MEKERCKKGMNVEYEENWKKEEEIERKIEGNEKMCKKSIRKKKKEIQILM
jgi:hypothetical protein